MTMLCIRCWNWCDAMRFLWNCFVEPLGTNTCIPFYAISQFLRIEFWNRMRGKIADYFDIELPAYVSMRILDNVTTCQITTISRYWIKTLNARFQNKNIHFNFSIIFIHFCLTISDESHNKIIIHAKTCALQIRKNFLSSISSISSLFSFLLSSASFNHYFKLVHRRANRLVLWAPNLRSPVSHRCRTHDTIALVLMSLHCLMHRTICNFSRSHLCCHPSDYSFEKDGPVDGWPLATIASGDLRRPCSDEL